MSRELEGLERREQTVRRSRTDGSKIGVENSQPMRHMPHGPMCVLIRTAIAHRIFQHKGGLVEDNAFSVLCFVSNMSLYIEHRKWLIESQRGRGNSWQRFSLCLSAWLCVRPYPRLFGFAFHIQKWSEPWVRAENFEVLKQNWQNNAYRWLAQGGCSRWVWPK